jgi:cytoskeleton protein RodZ
MAPPMPAAEVPATVPAAPAAPATAAAGSEMLLRFHGDSWVDIVDHQGVHLERGLLTTGSERRYAQGQVAEITLGDSTAVEVSAGGVPVDLSPFREAKVAHFTVSSEGRIGASAND